ncbi:hypothetical protein NDU88_003307 [Pleurodeles waltl]|uniref:Uncharacterized protein n=1 Tax=Pleurodeles waltl TaxID=8319 RepID=A0AAV7SEW6_PLEWA|nr:hypothetical protein NDU88_003307 [Pleurodeles waltl]
MTIYFLDCCDNEYDEHDYTPKMADTLRWSSPSSIFMSGASKGALNGNAKMDLGLPIVREYAFLGRRPDLPTAREYAVLLGCRSS